MKDNFSGFLYGLLTGAALGVVAGILLAPDKGSVTRSKLRSKIQDLSAEISDRFEDISDGNLDSILGQKSHGSSGSSGKARKKPGTVAKKPGRSPKTQTT